MTLSFFLWLVSVYFVFVMFWLIWALAQTFERNSLFAFIIGGIALSFLFISVLGFPSPFYRMVSGFQRFLGVDGQQEVIFAKEMKDGNVLVVIQRGESRIPRMYIMHMSKKEKRSLANAMGQRGQRGNVGKIIVKQGENAYGKRFIYVRSRKEMIRK